MRFYTIAIVFAFSIFVLVEGQRFNNPVLDGGDYPDPGVIFYNGLYYAVTTTNNDKPEKYPIHTSKDLQTWTFIGHVFNSSNFPQWTKGVDAEFWAPEIHLINGKFNMYFTSRDKKTDLVGLGLAVSDSITGPYIPQPEAFLVVGGTWVLDCTVINNDGKLMLAWVESLKIRVRNLTDDGLAFKDNITVPIFGPEGGWEGETTEGPWYIFRNNYHYMFYSGNNFCSDGYALGVARSSISAAGPYEKLPYPLLVSDAEFKGPGHGSIVRDVDGKGYVFVHHAWKTGAICGDNFRLMFSSTLRWGNDDWPLNMTIGG